MDIKIDYREFNLIKELERIHFSFTVENLSVYDIVIGDKFGIELKNGNDFLLSIYDKRLFEQIDKMNETGLVSFLVIYNNRNLYSFAKNRNVITGALLSLYFKKVFLIQVETIFDVIYIMKKISQLKENKDNSSSKMIYLKHRNKTLYERKINALSSAKNIGLEGSKLLIKHYKTLFGVMQNIKSVSEIKNIGDSIQNSLFDLFFR